MISTGGTDHWPQWTTWGRVCQKQASKAGTNNYISQYLWDVITCPCPWYLLLVHKSIYHMKNKIMDGYPIQIWITNEILMAQVLLSPYLLFSVFIQIYVYMHNIHIPSWHNWMKSRRVFIWKLTDWNTNFGYVKRVFDWRKKLHTCGSDDVSQWYGLWLI